MRFTLDQMLAFDSIARLGSFNAAARYLNLTQPTVSQRIRELEIAMGVSLFLRHGPRISLTPEGEALLDYADSMLKVSKAIVAHFDTRTPLKGILRFATNDTFAQVCLLDMIARVERIFPDLKVSVCVDNSGVISRLLDGREIDVAVVSEPDCSTLVSRIRVGRNPFGWVAAPTVEAPAGAMGPADLASHHIVLSAPPSRLYDNVMGWFAKAGAMPQRISTCNNISVIMKLIAAGTAVGVLPLSVIRGEINEGKVKALEVSMPLRSHDVFICYHADEARGGMQDIIELIQNIIHENKLFTS